MKSIRFAILFCGVAFALVIATPAGADDTGTLLGELRNSFKKDYLSVGALLQVVADVQPERTFSGQNGYSIANMRLNLSGKLDRGFGYFFQANLINEPSVLDARLRWQACEAFVLSAGKFKAPFSKELLTVASDIDFVNRARMIQTFSPGRQIGVMLDGRLAGRRLHVAGGMFNGNRSTTNGNDNNDFLYVGRLTTLLDLSAADDGSAEFGVSAAHSSDNCLTLPGDVMPCFSGTRLLLGADLRITWRRWLLAGEGLYARLQPTVGGRMEPYGFHATAGYMVSGNLQLLGRWDKYQSEDLFIDGDNSDLVLCGVNYWPSGATEVQINYIVDTDDTDIEHHQVLINVQIVF